MSVNKVILIGRLGQNPELRYTPSGAAVANFSVATNEVWTDKAGQRQERTEWHKVVAWGKQAELCNQYLQKGRQVYIEGALQTRQWQDQQGQNRSTTEIKANTIQFLGGAGRDAGASQGGASQYGGASAGANSGFGGSNFGAGEGMDAGAGAAGVNPMGSPGAEPSFTEDDIPF